MIRQTESLPMSASGDLWLLYRPIIGPRACMLYEYLCALSSSLSQIQKLPDLLGIVQMSENQFLQARKELEQLHLIATFANDERTEFLIWVRPPKRPREFLQHEIFSRMLLNETSAAYISKIQAMYDLKFTGAGMSNISSKLTSSRLEEHWNEEKEIIHQKQTPPKLEISYPFDWELFFRGQKRTIPDRLRTDRNKSRIAMLANIYGISEEQMRRLVTRYMDDDKTLINFDELENDLKFTTRRNPEISKNNTDPFQLPPVTFYESLQKNGSEALPDEKKLISDLCLKLSFSNELMNTLIDYCLTNCQMKFIPTIIRREANTWARRGITTRKQALEFISNQTLFQNSRAKRNSEPPKADGSTLPEWYKQTKVEKADEDLLAQAMAMQEKIK